ncbi:hypothetical protein CLV62_1014 [Dysgonomonas alginatilytica]|uniref:Uncharacterized protein n=1 Tax=Dysgonomonas alginatilytica TaxID=1605892 RepID=A0A2V3PUG1_9BACT|nr:hypothetical protein [Dysgonomonas alginatilytica]PXV68742.1 hypothetical protein CLV62_1014 [Dysgonomonas alginatilytica]
MGLTIHYSGRIKTPESLYSLIEEVKDISNIYGWKYRIHESKFPNDTFDENISYEAIYGITFTPPESESISLTFLSNGQIVCPSRVYFFKDSKNESEKASVFIVSTKTQYAGVIVHQLVIHLLKYLDENYLQDFKVRDESHYWETGDESLMKYQFKEYDKLLDNFVLSLQTFPMEPGESFEMYFDRLIKHLNKIKGK